ncbi:unnamed protein product [Peniophora sp. CBMAI 1063]|nr:unnamed protein product [Peniophora sp. CBMAI 1063]
MSTLITLYFLLILALLGLRWIRHERPSTLEQVRGVLAPHALPLEAHLRRRSSANTRLARVFKLSNTFVHADRSIHKTFVADARSLLQRWDAATFPDVTRTVLDAYSKLLPASIAFDSLVQLITFTLVAETLLGGHIAPEEWREVLVVTQGINHLWEASKKTTRVNAENNDLRAKMDASLRRWLPHLANPLDFVIPAYETMWRVVAVLIGRVAGTTNAGTLLAYFDDPRDITFRVTTDGPSAEALVKEVLRLHSPVRRISRSTSSSRLSRALCAALPRWVRPTSICTADLDALHRDVSIWGKSAGDFDATRFDSSRLTPEQNAAWTPFGHGPLSCVAARDAPHLAALIAGAVIERLHEGGWKLQRGPRLGARRGWDGWSVGITPIRSTTA